MFGWSGIPNKPLVYEGPGARGLTRIFSGRNPYSHEIYNNGYGSMGTVLGTNIGK